MKNKSTLVSLVFATGSVVALVMILGNLESPSSSPSTTNTVVLPASPVKTEVAPVGQGKVVSTGILYEFDFDDERDYERDNVKHDAKGKHDGKGKKYGKNNQALPSKAADSASTSTSTSIPSTTSTLDSTQIQQNPKQSTTQAS